jgi:hypothetical protein
MNTFQKFYKHEATSPSLSIWVHIAQCGYTHMCLNHAYWLLATVILATLHKTVESSHSYVIYGNILRLNTTPHF